MYTIQNIKVPSSDGIHLLKGIIYCPENKIRGIFHLVHGMTEYIGRYAHLFEFLAENGYLVCGYDNLGHGQTANGDSELGFISPKNGYEYLIQDVKLFEDYIVEHYPRLPVVLMGHSMGSFIARLAAERNPSMLSGLIICGTVGPLAAAPFGLALTSLLAKIYGKKHISPLAEALAFGSFNKKFEGKTKYDWLTTDRSVIEKYSGDKYCTFHFTVLALHDLIKLNEMANRRQWFYTLDRDLPVLIISGTEDPVGNYGKGVRNVYRLLEKSGKKNVSMKLYEGCRHEIHNDKCADRMFEDIKSFVNGITDR